MKNVNAMLEVLFNGVQLKRWNGLSKPKEFVETAKQGLNAAIAYIMAVEYEECGLGKVNYLALIELSICRMLYKVIFTDISPRISYRLLSGEKEDVNKFALKMANEFGFDKEFISMFKQYLEIKDKNDIVELDIFHAASKIATKWEFEQIKRLSSNTNYLMKRVEGEIDERLSKISTCEFFKQFASWSFNRDFIDLYGNTIFVKRWSRLEMTPSVSDLSHMYMTAVITYMMMQKANASDERCAEGFYAGLFHDLIEILTGDIPHGLKAEIPGLKEKLTEIEEEEYDKHIDKIFPTAFKNFRMKLKGYILSQIATEDKAMVKMADNVCAFLEGVTSFLTGTPQKDFVRMIENDYRDFSHFEIEGVKVYEIYEYFYGKYRANIK